MNGGGLSGGGMWLELTENASLLICTDIASRPLCFILLRLLGESFFWAGYTWLALLFAIRPGAQGFGDVLRDWLLLFLCEGGAPCPRGLTFLCFAKGK